MLVVIGVIAFYETMKHLARLAIKQRLRQSMMLLFSTALFSNYYSWWVYINYWNDDFYSQWYHQLFFSVTELISTAWVVHLADKKNAITHRKAFGIAAIALLHIMAGGWDQFFVNVVRGEGHAHQVRIQIITTNNYEIREKHLIDNKRLTQRSYAIWDS